MLFDNDPEGESGARRALWELAQQNVDVRLAWSRSMYGGRFTDEQPEDLNAEAWAELRAYINANRRVDKGA